MARAIESTEAQVAAKWGPAVKAAERSHEERLAAAMARIEALEKELKAVEAKGTARLSEARDEAELMREQLERAEGLKVRAERAAEAKAAEAFSMQRAGHEEEAQRQMMDTLKVRSSHARLSLTCATISHARLKLH